MIPTIQYDRVALRAGYLHTNFQRTGLSKVARISQFTGPTAFSVAPKEGGTFALSTAGGEIESFRLEKHALIALTRVTDALAADPDRKWQGHRRYALLLAGAFLTLTGGAAILNAAGPAPAAPSAYSFQSPAAPGAFQPASAPVSQSAPDRAANAAPPTRRAIHFGKADAPPEKTLYVFSDPQCPHCRDLERSLAGMPADYGIYVFATPFLLGAEDLTAKIHCAADPKKAWRDAMAGQPVGGSGSCEKAGWGKENVDFFRSVGLTATPTLVAGIDGRIRTGTTDLPSLLSWMKAK